MVPFIGNAMDHATSWTCIFFFKKNDRKLKWKFKITDNNCILCVLDRTKPQHSLTITTFHN